MLTNANMGYLLDSPNANVSNENNRVTIQEQNFIIETETKKVKSGKSLSNSRVFFCCVFLNNEFKF